MLWGVSGIGEWVPWAGGGYIASALVGRTLRLWLGVLDVVQGVGFGMVSTLLPFAAGDVVSTLLNVS